MDFSKATSLKMRNSKLSIRTLPSFKTMAAIIYIYYTTGRAQCIMKLRKDKMNII